MDNDEHIWPPPPAGQVPQETSIPKIWHKAALRWLLIPLPSVAGAICLIIGNSGPNTTGLRGQAFETAFDANEDLMLWLIIGYPMILTGFVVGLCFCRSWPGKVAIVIPLLILAWAFFGGGSP